MDDMDLPDGKTCEDCHWFERCLVLFRCPAESTRCDFAPSRFHVGELQPKQKTGGLADAVKIARGGDVPVKFKGYA